MPDDRRDSPEFTTAWRNLDPGAHLVLRVLRTEIRDLRRDYTAALARIRSLEQQTPQARQLQYEADLAAADLAASGYDDRPGPIGVDRHGAGCQCPYCYDEPEDYHPGPETDDQGGMSEYRSYAAIADTWDER